MSRREIGILHELGSDDLLHDPNPHIIPTCPLSRPHPQTTTANAMTAIALPFFIFTPLIFMMSCA